MKKCPASRKITTAAALLALWGGVSACDRQSRPEGAMTTAPVQVSDDRGQESVRGGDYSLGIPACDDFFKKYEKCILENAPLAERHALRFAYEKTVEQVHLQYQEDKDSVLAICPKLLEGAKIAMSAYRCAW